MLLRVKSLGPVVMRDEQNELVEPNSKKKNTNNLSRGRRPKDESPAVS